METRPEVWLKDFSCLKIFSRGSHRFGLWVGMTSVPVGYTAPGLIGHSASLWFRRLARASSARAGAALRAARGARSLGRGVLGFHVSFPGLSHFLFLPVPARPQSPGCEAAPPAGSRPPPPGTEGREFLWVPGVPRVRSKTGNCKRPHPSALPRGFPVTPAPLRLPRS